MESLYRHHRFPPEIITHAVWLYHRFTLSLRDVEDLQAKPGVVCFTEIIRLGGDKGYDDSEFIRELRRMKVTPHVAQNEKRAGGRTYDGTSSPRLLTSQAVLGLSRCA